MSADYENMKVLRDTAMRASVPINAVEVSNKNSIREQSCVVHDCIAKLHDQLCTIANIVAGVERKEIEQYPVKCMRDDVENNKIMLMQCIDLSTIILETL